jgi:hypothetical protein
MLENELTEAIDAIAHAIVQQRHLTFRYKGHFRRVMPLIFGRSHDGRWRLRALQIGGTSRWGFAGDMKPRIFNLLDMNEVQILDSTFRVPRQYEPEDEFITQPEVQLPSLRVVDTSH